MPNVNYRGKPSQDPNAPPESGMTSIPLGAPWPPLSREQVAELHQELVEFYAGMKRCVDLGINDSARAAYAERLTIVLHRLGIGSPPPTRTWTHEEIAKVAEEVQVEPPKRNCWTCDHDKVFGGGTAHICTALPPRRSKGTGDSPTVKAISAWTDSQTLDASLMPPKDSDGCPGWEPKP